MELHVHDMVWAVINFLVMVVILNKLLYKPILGVLEKRKQEIQQNLDQAATARAEALKMKSEYDKEMQQVKQKAQEILDQAAKIGEETKDRIIAEARDEASKITEKAQAIVRMEKEQALAELRDEVATLAVMAAGKVIDKSLQKEDHEKLIHDFIQEVRDVS